MPYQLIQHADGVRLDVSQFFTATDVRETAAAIRKVSAHFLAKQGIRLEPARVPSD